MKKTLIAKVALGGHWADGSDPVIEEGTASFAAMTADSSAGVSTIKVR